MNFKKNYGLVIALIFLLTGCVKGDVNITFTSNSANMDIEILFPESFISNYNTSLDELKSKLNETGLQEWTCNDLKESINGVTYLGLELIAPEHINKNLISFLHYNKENKNYNVQIDLNTISQLYDASELKDINNYSIDNLKSIGLELDLNITMPGTIKETNYGKINNNQVQINLLDLLTQKKISPISITSTQTTATPSVVNLIIIITLVVILYLILRKSK